MFRIIRTSFSVSCLWYIWYIGKSRRLLSTRLCGSERWRLFLRVRLRHTWRIDILESPGLPSRQTGGRSKGSPTIVFLTVSSPGLWLRSQERTICMRWWHVWPGNRQDLWDLKCSALIGSLWQERQGWNRDKPTELWKWFFY